jgi:hypothetical protein
VQGYIALAPPYGGSTYAIASKLGGTKWNLLAFIGDLLQPIINELVYQGSRGLPSMLMLMPNTRLWGKEFVSRESSGGEGRGVSAAAAAAAAAKTAVLALHSATCWVYCSH